jgi:FAD/FMN-containing dehydrogenase
LNVAVASREIAALCDGCSATVAPRHDIFFLATLDRASGFVQTVLEMAIQTGYPSDRIGIYIQPQHQGVSQHVEFTIPYDAADKKDAAQAKRLFTAASQALIAQGAYFSRPYGPWADLVYSRDATATRVLRTVKQIVDPNHVMNPGKLCF